MSKRLKVTLDIRIIKFVDSIEENYKMIAFGDSEEEERIENYVVLQRAKNFDQQDKELDTDTYYIEYNDNQILDMDCVRKFP